MHIHLQSQCAYNWTDTYVVGRFRLKGGRGWGKQRIKMGWERLREGWDEEIRKETSGNFSERRCIRSSVLLAGNRTAASGDCLTLVLGCHHLILKVSFTKLIWRIFRRDVFIILYTSSVFRKVIFVTFYAHRLKVKSLSYVRLAKPFLASPLW